MSDTRDTSPERSSQEDEDSDDKNVKKEKVKKNVKVENIKRENEYKRKLREISPPKVRKILHKTMSKYYNGPYHDTNDIAKKILKKLKVPPTYHFMKKMKEHMEKWISNNVVDHTSDEDSSDESNKKETKDVKKEKTRKVKPKASEKNKPSGQLDNLLESEAVEVPKEDAVPASDKSQPSNATQKTVKVEQTIPFIDLTSDLKEEVKKEVITIIDEDDHDDGNKAVSTSVNGTAPVQQMPYPSVPGYNPSLYYPPTIQQMPYPMVPAYTPVYQNYYDPNSYQPYFPYGYQYPYNHYNVYRPSDFLPSYPIDEAVNNPNVNCNNTIGSHPTDSKDAGDSQTIKGSEIRQ